MSTYESVQAAAAYLRAKRQERNAKKLTASVIIAECFMLGILTGLII